MDLLKVPANHYGHRRTPSNSSVSSGDSSSSLEYAQSYSRRPSSSMSTMSCTSARSLASPTCGLKIQNQPEYKFLMKNIEQGKVTGSSRPSTAASSRLSTAPSSNPYRNIRTPVVDKPKRKVTFVDGGEEDLDSEQEEKTDGKGHRGGVPLRPKSPLKRRTSITADYPRSRRSSMTQEGPGPPSAGHSRPRTAPPARRGSVTSISSSSRINRPGSANPGRFDADRDFPEGIGSTGMSGVQNLTMHLEDLQNPGKLITITMSYSTAAVHNSKIFCADIMRANKKREKAMGMLIKEIERRLATQHRKRDEREKQRQEEEERERKRLEEEQSSRGMGGRGKREDGLKRRDVSLLTTADVRQLRKQRISRQSQRPGYRNVNQKRKSIYSEHAVL